ncbi:MAG: hypothetical protein U1E65_19320 [Myxococcota bacterium]
MTDAAQRLRESLRPLAKLQPDPATWGTAEERRVLELAEEIGFRAEENLQVLMAAGTEEGFMLWLRLLAAAERLSTNLGLRARGSIDGSEAERARRAAAASRRLAEVSWSRTSQRSP